MNLLVVDFIRSNDRSRAAVAVAVDLLRCAGVVAVDVLLFVGVCERSGRFDP